MELAIVTLDFLSCTNSNINENINLRQLIYNPN